MTREEKLIKSKLGLLELGEYPQNLKSLTLWYTLLCRYQ
jgi:hypothetical protein